MNVSVLEQEVETGGPLTAIDGPTFRSHFNRKPFKIGHTLADNPLFSLTRLIELAQRLPVGRVEYNAGNLPLTQDPKSTPLNGLTIAETIRRIEECQSWMVLKNVELDQEYRQLLDACLDAIMPHSDPIAPGMSHREGFIFISSAGSVTPFHIDPENNFLLQVRGEKEVHLFDARDRVVLPEADIEAFYAGAHRNLTFKPEFETRGEKFTLVPGEGLHFPVIAPHYVKNGPYVSISFSITFRTKASDATASLYRFNTQLRRCGLRPAPIGTAPLREALKLGAVHLGRAAKRIVSKQNPSDTRGYQNCLSVPGAMLVACGGHGTFLWELGIQETLAG